LLKLGSLYFIPILERTVKTGNVVAILTHQIMIIIIINMIPMITTMMDKVAGRENNLWNRKL